MPPYKKFNREVILQTAFYLVREHGIDKLNARNIAKALHSSTQPVFSCYKTMADLKADLFIMANRYYRRYFGKVEAGKNLFLNFALTYVNFAIEESNLFKFLFSPDKNEPSANPAPGVFARNTDTNLIFTDMRLYAHGIASLIVTKQLCLERSEIVLMLKNMFNLLSAEQPTKQALLPTSRDNPAL